MPLSPGACRRLRDRARARRDGKRDGLLGIPTRDEVVHPPALVQIARRADETLAELVRSWVGEDARLRERVGTTTQEVRASEDDVRAASAELTVAEQRRRAADESDAAAEPAQRAVGLGPRVYAVAIVAILIAEFPLNAIAFRLFGEAEVLTWVMTASLAVTLVLCAHGLGSFLRQPHPTLAERRWIFVLVALPVLAIVAIALIRARYLSLEAATGLDVLGPVVGSLVFLVINLLVYTGATMLSYLAHSPRTARRHRGPSPLEETRRDLGAAEQRLREATGRVRRSEQHLSHADVAAEEVTAANRARAAEIVAYHRGLMAVYCAANLRARGAPEVPPVLRDLPAIAVPSALQEPEVTGEHSRNGQVPEASLAALHVTGDAS
jgi:hypothetical protein